MRLIDGDKLIKDIDYSADMGGALGKVVECAKYYAKFMVASAPTIEERKTGRAVYQAGYADGYNSAQLERKGKWIQDQKSKRYRCDQCLSFALKTDDMQENLSDFCPVCGSSMTKGEQP